MKLFICHASEDKESFVRQLAEELRSKHELWYDELSLTIGDSLLRKINEGLASCDFAVVVLSPSFFQKKWPQNELDGLFALEGENRKLILPIWKDLSQAEVAKYSPILAGRRAAQASDGVTLVVKQIQAAIDASTRTREIDEGGSVIAEALKIGKSIEEQNNAFILSHSPEGVALILTDMKQLAGRFRVFEAGLAKESQPLKIEVRETPMAGGSDSDFLVATNYGQTLNIGIVGIGGNWTHTAELHARLMQRNHVPDPGPVRVFDLVFKPTFRLSKQVVWKAGGEQIFTAPQLADHLFEKLLRHIERRISVEHR
jgi:TIR domain